MLAGGPPESVGKGSCGRHEQRRFGTAIVENRIENRVLSTSFSQCMMKQIMLFASCLAVLLHQGCLRYLG